MIKIEDKSKCCGCTACCNICPTNAITMEPDKEGFLYPKIDIGKCIGCGKCENVCPVLSDKKRQDNLPRSYVMRAKDRDVLKSSTSGGFVTPLSQYVIGEGGVVCAAGYDDNWNVRHMFFGSRDGENPDLSSMRGSKYVQSNLSDCFVKIRKFLEEGRKVCFVGTPCQVAGLKAFLKKEYEELITVDLVCRGVSSPKLWSKYISYQQEKNKSKISGISFRNKTYGYHSSTMRISFKNAKVYHGSGRVDYMLKSYYRDISSRPICYKCPFKTLKRCSDFTIYDCWHASSLVLGLSDDDGGYTNVMAQSEKGEKILEEIKEQYEMYPVDTKKAVSLDGIMVTKPAMPHKKRNEYYDGIDDDTLPEHIVKFIPVSFKDRILEHSKIIIYRLGLYRVLKGMKGS